MTFNPKAKPGARKAAVERLIAELNSNQAPILCGPWRSELGFEVSYWIPFLRFLSGKVTRWSERASAVTRGGASALYSGVSAQSVDLFALREAKDARRENLYDQQVRQQGKTIKQVEPTDWDEAVLEDAAHALGIKGLYHTIHPAWMYWALAPYWDEQVGLRYLADLTDYTPLPKVTMDGQLPPKYVAVKFYARHTFPYPHPDVEHVVRQTVTQLAQQIPVVTLSTGQDHDDHHDIPLSGPNIYSLPKDVPVEENLKVQAAVISHASAFVGTYGGVAQLALRLGIPSYSLYAQWSGTAHAHYSLSSWLSKKMGVPFVALSITEASMIGQMLGQKMEVTA